MSKRAPTFGMSSIAIASGLALLAFILGRALLFPSSQSDSEPLLRRQTVDTQADPKSQTQPSDPELQAVVANVQYSPEQVVALQVNALVESETYPERIEICYGLASPDNRTVTGPLERFATMVRTVPYDQFIGAQETQVGKAELEEGFANVLVSGISKASQPFAYRFLLSKQSVEPFTDCWMTDTVIPISFVDFQGSVISQTEESENGVPL